MFAGNGPGAMFGGMSRRKYLTLHGIGAHLHTLRTIQNVQQIYLTLLYVEPTLSKISFQKHLRNNKHGTLLDILSDRHHRLVVKFKVVDVYISVFFT